VNVLVSRDVVPGICRYDIVAGANVLVLGVTGVGPRLPPLALTRIRFGGSVLVGTLSARMFELPGVVGIDHCT